jgi:hypothetical protein
MEKEYCSNRGGECETCPLCKNSSDCRGNPIYFDFDAALASMDKDIAVESEAKQYATDKIDQIFKDAAATLRT